MSASGVLERTADVAGTVSGGDDEGGGGGSRKIVLWLIALIVVPVLIFAGYTTFLMVAIGGGASECAPGSPDAGGPPADTSSTMMANAQTIYSVFSAWGMPDENIAGILGNWEQESGMDPTRVQRTANTPYEVSPAEQAGAENTDNGIGLGQWTFGRNSNLRNYASGHGQSWGSLEIQLGFMLSAAEGGNADIVRQMISTSQGTPQAAAVFFHDKWERSADASTAKREANAARWMGLISGWDADQALAQKILEQSGSTLGDPGASYPRGRPSGCGSSTVVGQAAFPLSPGYQMTSGYGPRDIDVPGASSWHTAIDLQHWPNPCGDPVYAVLPGTVTLSSSLWLSIKHADGFVVSYLHMYKSERLVDVGDTVTAGQQIGVVGNVPPSGGCHLDLRINKNGTTNQAVAALQEATALGAPSQYAGYVNPEEFLRLYGIEICPTDGTCRRL